ncbi:hypothetical protein D3C80_1086590 [compost metagenome]
MALVLRIVKIDLAKGFIPAPVNEDLSAVFIIARRQRAGDAVWIERVNHPKTKAVALRLMLFGIAIEIFPQHRGQDEFGIKCRFQELRHGRSMRRIKRGNIPQGKITFQV